MVARPAKSKVRMIRGRAEAVVARTAPPYGWLRTSRLSDLTNAQSETQREGCPPPFLHRIDMRLAQVRACGADDPWLCLAGAARNHGSGNRTRGPLQLGKGLQPTRTGRPSTPIRSSRNIRDEGPNLITATLKNFAFERTPTDESEFSYPLRLSVSPYSA